MLAVYASPPPSPAVDARLATGLRAADFPDRTFTGKSTSALHGALPYIFLAFFAVGLILFVFRRTATKHVATRSLVEDSPIMQIEEPLPADDVIGATVARLRVFPFKALPGADIRAAALTRRGGLLHDREFALFDESGYVNGKRNADVDTLRVWYDDTLSSAAFTSVLNGERFVFDLDESPRKLEAWLARHFGKRVTVRRESDGGFPDDTAARGPTVISTATLAVVAGWFPELDTDSVRSRLRTNIEIDGVPAFWEDRLFCGTGTAVPFAVGETLLEGTNPCQRCVVPSRDPDTGSPITGFAKRVAEGRAATLPAWADATRFDHSTDSRSTRARRRRRSTGRFASAIP
jgi:uncharacterized protein YcbX